MKIMINITGLRKGGAERVVSVLANKLVKKYDIDILVQSSKGIAYNIDKKAKILSLEEKRNKMTIVRNLERLINSKKIIEKERPDIIITFLPTPSYRVLALKNKVGKIPIIVADRNDPKQEYKSIIDKILMNILYKKADGFVFQTKEQQEFFEQRIKENSTIIYNPIKDEFTKDGNEDNIKKEKVIISVGRLTAQKNQKILIDAFSRVSQKYLDYKLRIFGTGELEEELKKQIKKLNIEDKVELCGVSNNIKNELQKSEIFVMPSNYEGMPNALIEAMAVGLPVIATDCPCGGPRELIKNNVNGILVPLNDEESIRKNIELLIENKELALQLGNEAKKIREMLNADKIVEQWEEYIKYVLNKKGNKYEEK